MLNPDEIAEMRHTVQFKQRPIEGEAVTISFVGGPLDGLHSPVRAPEACHPFIEMATVTPTGCVVASYTGDPAETVRYFEGYRRPGGNALPGQFRGGRR